MNKTGKETRNQIFVIYGVKVVFASVANHRVFISPSEQYHGTLFERKYANALI